MNSRIKVLLKFCYFLPWNVVNKLQFAIKKVDYGTKLETNGVLFVSNKGRIKLGDNIRINSRGTANPIGTGTRTYIQVLPKASLTIGNGTRLSNCAITVQSQIVLGKNVRLGSGVRLFDTDFHSIIPSERLKSPEVPGKTAPIVISDNVFIGAGCFVLKGVTIGESAVIGAGSVLTKNVGPYEIWAGNPAKKIGEVPR